MDGLPKVDNWNRFTRNTGGTLVEKTCHFFDLMLQITQAKPPRLVLLDEPSEGLAPVIVEQMALAVGRLKQEGLSVLLSEQNLRFAGAVADRVYVIESGHIRFAGPVGSCSRTPRSVGPIPSV